MERIRTEGRGLAPLSGVIVLVCLLAPVAASGQQSPEPGPGDLGMAGRPGCGDFVPDTGRLESEVDVVELSRDGRRVYVGHSTPERYGSGGRSRLTVLDHSTGDELLRANLGSHGRVTDVWASHEGTRIWVATEKEGRVVTVESTTGNVLMMWVIGSDSPQRGSVSPDDRFLYVTSRDGGTVTLIDRVTTGAKTVELTPGLSGLALAPDGGEIWVANREMDRVTVLDARDGAVRARLPSGGMAPVDVAFHPSGREVWVVHHWSAELAVFDAREREVLAVIPLTERPVTLRFPPDGEVAYVGLERGGMVRVDPASRSVTDTTARSRELPGRLAASRAALTGCTGTR